MANIGIYGGSFNPPHKGHMLAAAQCRAALGLERVIVIPAAVPPHKALADGSPDAQTRLALTKLAVRGLDGFEVSDLELRRVFITHSGLPEEMVQKAVETVQKLQPFDEICITRAGCTVSSHCGPGTIGVLYIRKAEA